MSKFLNSLSKLIVDGYTSLSEKAEEITKIGRIKLEIIATKRDIEKIFVELGGRFYHNFDSSEKSDLFTDPEIKEIVSKAKNMEDKLSHLKEKLEKLKKEEGVDLD